MWQALGAEEKKKWEEKSKEDKERYKRESDAYQKVPGRGACRMRQRFGEPRPAAACDRLRSWGTAAACRRPALRLPPSTTAPTPRSCDRRGAGLIAAACGAGAEIQGRADGGRVQQNGALQCGWGDPAWVKSARFVFVRVRHPPLAQRGFVAHLTAPCGGRATARMTRIRTQTLEPAGQRPPPQERATQTTVTTRTDYGGALYNGMNDEYTAAMFCRCREWASPCFGCVGSASCLG